MLVAMVFAMFNLCYFIVFDDVSPVSKTCRGV